MPKIRKVARKVDIVPVWLFIFEHGNDVLESVCEGSGQVVDDAGNGRVGRVGNRYGGVDDAGNDWCPLSRNVRGLLESVYEGSGQGNGRVGRVDRYDCYDDDGR